MVTATWCRVNGTPGTSRYPPGPDGPGGTTLAAWTNMQPPSKWPRPSGPWTSARSRCWMLSERVDERNPALNAVIWRNDEEARSEAKRLGDRIAVGADDLPPSPGYRSRSRTCCRWPGSR